MVDGEGSHRMLPRIGVIVGSTRPGRVGPQVAQWVFDVGSHRDDAEFELVDIESFNLPVLDEPVQAGLANRSYTKQHTRTWSAKIDTFDGFVFVTAEYNRGIPGALKNAIDFLYPEWTNKAAGFVSYGGAGGTRAVEQLRLVMGMLQIADVQAQVPLSLYTDFEHMTEFNPGERQTASLTPMFNQVITWSLAMRAVRDPKST